LLLILGGEQESALRALSRTVAVLDGANLLAWKDFQAANEQESAQVEQALQLEACSAHGRLQCLRAHCPARTFDEGVELPLWDPHLFQDERQVHISLRIARVMAARSH